MLDTSLLFPGKHYALCVDFDGPALDYVAGDTEHRIYVTPVNSLATPHMDRSAAATLGLVCSVDLYPSRLGLYHGNETEQAGYAQLNRTVREMNPDPRGGRGPTPWSSTSTGSARSGTQEYSLERVGCTWKSAAYLAKECDSSLRRGRLASAPPGEERTASTPLVGSTPATHRRRA